MAAKLCYQSAILQHLIISAAIIAFTTSITGCKHNNQITANYPYGYFPLSTNHYVAYHVDSIFYSYNNIHTRDTVTYEWKVEVGDTFYDKTGQLNYELNCYRRPNSNYQWIYNRKWYAIQNTSNILVAEDDLKFVKLVFPVLINNHWNGNEYLPALNPSTPPFDCFSGWDYYYANIDTVFSLNSALYEHALVVSEVNSESLIQKVLRREVYVNGIGMIYQEWEAMNKDVQADWNTGPQNGFRIRMSMIDHN
jgi:hypothetical protein